MTLPDWQPADTLSQPPEAALYDWLCEPGSLTSRLQALGSFRVELLRESALPARADEAAALGVAPGSPLWTREVLLHSNGTPCIFARSVMRPEQLTNSPLRLAELGSRSLGERLFGSPDVQRGPIQISRWPDEWLPDPWRGSACWARRSLFSATHLQLLVCEVFLPGWSAGQTA